MTFRAISVGGFTNEPAETLPREKFLEVHLRARIFSQVPGGRSAGHLFYLLKVAK
jgi:hypothetical protein